MIEFQNVVGYVLELLHIFNPNLGKRPEKSISNGHFVIQGKLQNMLILSLSHRDEMERRGNLNYFELRNSSEGFFSNSEDKNLIEF